ncbi:unnamed protein product [Polarella glacialis]|uniref:Uncharacterized protein n=1 Tax=Polarella glacialis TaxID=89957 RepID=A0A813HSP9_POLGL|nr:unnamed protein product [Polarella glacialis]
MEPDGRTLQLYFFEDEPVLRLRGEAKRDSFCWMQEIRRRLVDMASSSQKLQPCVSFAEAQDMAQDIQQELAEEQAEHMQLAAESLSALRHKTLLTAIRAVVATSLHRNARHALHELALHSRLKSLGSLQRRAATQRLVRALGSIWWKRVDSVFAAFRGPVRLVETTAEVGPDSRHARAQLKQVQLGVALLASVQDNWSEKKNWSESPLRAAVSKLHLHAASAKTQSVEGGLVLKGKLSGERGELDDSMAVFAKRLRAGVCLLSVILRNSREAQLEWALRAMEVYAERASKQKARELIHRTQVLNEQLSIRCRQLPLAGFAACLVLSLKAAQSRHVLSALLSLRRATVARRPRSAAASPAVIERLDFLPWPRNHRTP